MKIVLRRLVLPLALFLVWAPAASAWSWPVQGPVLQAFVYDEAHPYDAGQHRGIDIGADAAGEAVTAPATGTVSFAGTVPTSGTCVTIQTPDGYSVTLTHLGSALVAGGAAVAEGDAVGTIGPSGTPEFARPYVHLGIRTTSDQNGYLDPLGFLPPVSTADPPPSDAAPAPAPAPAASAGSQPSTAPQPAVPTSRTHARSHHGRGHVSRPRAARSATGESSASASSAPRATRVRRGSEPPSSQLSTPASGSVNHARVPHRRSGEPTSSWRRPVVEAATSPGPRGLDAGHETERGAGVPPVRRPQSRSLGPPLPLVLNGAAAAVALAAAFAAAHRRRRTASRRPEAAQILRLSLATTEYERVRLAA